MLLTQADAQKSDPTIPERSGTAYGGRRRDAVVFMVLACAAAALCLLLLWSRGCLSVAQRSTSPDGSTRIIAYDRNLSGAFPSSEGVTIRVIGDGDHHYGGVSFENSWWSPDSRYFLLSLVQDGEPELFLEDYEKNAVVVLGGRFNGALWKNSDFPDLVYDGSGNPEIAFRFEQWEEQSGVFRMRYWYTDTHDRAHAGLCRFDCEDGMLWTL
ncbi:MAG TPA: hypothetical protein IAB39_00535 [Candidatus Onthovicinus excrementipullorum]|nr:hypothetical protein [Candidatus Onthovicinus excrementipullorum]